jgi:hypothetical protein
MTTDLTPESDPLAKYSTVTASVTPYTGPAGVTSSGVGVYAPTGNDVPYSTSIQSFVSNTIPTMDPKLTQNIPTPSDVTQNLFGTILNYTIDGANVLVSITDQSTGDVHYQTSTPVNGLNLDALKTKLVSDLTKSAITGNFSPSVAASLTSIAGSLTSSSPSSLSSFQNYSAQTTAIQAASTVAKVVDVALGAQNDPLSAVTSLFGLGSSPSTTNSAGPPPTLSNTVMGVDTSGTKIVSSTTLPNINTTKQINNTTAVNAYIAPIPTANNPVNQTQPAIANPDTRTSAPIANEPPVNRESQYPYNKATQTEGGHLLEIDDTPGKERILTQHVTGTYDEMNHDGSRVTKVVHDNYTIVAGDDYVSIQGKCNVRIIGDATVRIGGHLTMQADAGINFASKGDFRVKARSICMDAESGDFSMKSAKNIDLLAAADHNSKAKNHNIESTQITSIKTPSTFVVNSKDYSVVATGDINVTSQGNHNQSSQGDTNITAQGNINQSIKGDYNVTAQGALNETAKGAMNLLASGQLAVKGSSIEMGATTNFQGQTNLQGPDAQGGLVSPITGTGAGSASAAAAATPATKFEANPAAEAKGSGLAYTTNPDRIIDDADDDPVAAAAAIKHGLENGLINPDELNQAPTVGGSDNAPPGSTSASLTKPTVGNLGNGAPPENLKLSPRFTVAMLSSSALAVHQVIQPQHGLSTTQIVGNLQLVATNCLELIKSKYPDMAVTCGFRAAGYKATYGAKGTSQHELGEACDLQFKSGNADPSQYFYIAQWIKNNVPFDQLLLEYKSTGSKLPWIHISFSQSRLRHQVLTLNNGVTYSQNLTQLR